MKLKSLFDVKKLFNMIFNLKNYISWNLIALIGYSDLLYCMYFYNVVTGMHRFSAGDILLIISVYYSIYTRIVFFILLLIFGIEKKTNFKLKQNKFTNNQIYNIFFLFGLIYFSVSSLIILISIISIFVIILLFY